MTLSKNIIFDLGGVILTIDYKRTIEAFRNLGISNAEDLYSKAAQSSLFDTLEKGLLSENNFFTAIRLLSDKPISNNQIKEAWNAILIGLPEENISVLEKLKNNHRLFLLSNTNSIHETAYKEMIVKQYGSFIFDELFAPAGCHGDQWCRFTAWHGCGIYADLDRWRARRAGIFHRSAFAGTGRAHRNPARTDGRDGRARHRRHHQYHFA